MASASDRPGDGRCWRRWGAALGVVAAAALASLASLAVCPPGPPFGALIRSANASTFIELGLPELVARATSVVVATPLGSNSVWEEAKNGAGRRIVTYTRVKVSRVLAGVALEEAWVRTLGGQVGNIGQHVDGDAVLIPEQPALLFLKALPDGPHAVVGMAQGQYPLQAPLPGAPPKLLALQNAGQVLSAPPAPDRLAPARTLLAGKTVDEVAELIATARRAHGP